MGGHTTASSVEVVLSCICFSSDLLHNRFMIKPAKSKTPQVQDGSKMVRLDVTLIGCAKKDGNLLSFEQIADAATAFSGLGQVFHQPPCAAIVQIDGETLGVTAHRLCIHVQSSQVLRALDTVHSYRSLVLPDAYVIAEVASIMVVGL